MRANAVPVSQRPAIKLVILLAPISIFVVAVFWIRRTGSGEN